MESQSSSRKECEPDSSEKLVGNDEVLSVVPPNLKNPISLLLNALRKSQYGNRVDSLYIGHGAKLTAAHFEELQSFGLPMKNFDFNGCDRDWESGLPLQNLLNSWRETLQWLRLKSSPALELEPMIALKRLSVTFTLDLVARLPLTTQFPVLEELSIKFEAGFDWKCFLPEGMPNHDNLKCLKILQMRPRGTVKSDFLLRFVEKCPQLEFLYTSNVEEYVMAAIWQKNESLVYSRITSVAGGEIYVN